MKKNNKVESNYEVLLLINGDGCADSWSLDAEVVVIERGDNTSVFDSRKYGGMTHRFGYNFALTDSGTAGQNINIRSILPVSEYCNVFSEHCNNQTRIMFYHGFDLTDMYINDDDPESFVIHIKCEGGHFSDPKIIRFNSFAEMKQDVDDYLREVGGRLIERKPA